MGTFVSIPLRVTLVSRPQAEAHLPTTDRARARDGGGGGSRTRVRKHVVVGLYMRVRICFLVPDVRMRPKPPGTSLGKSRGHAPRRRVATSLFNGVRPSTTRRGQGERHCLIKQRERTDCPQLTDVPSDLRVNGARHASRNPVPPSKPNSPPAEVIARAPVHAPGRWRTDHCTASATPEP